MIQAVGRALRRPGGSAKIGTVVLPVLLAGAADPDDPMAGVDEASLKVVAGVLRTHDESLA